MSIDKTDRPILITGGCGFIGCNLADRLASQGCAVKVLDTLARGGARENAQWLKSRHGNRIELIIADVREPAPVMVAARDAQAILHLAAQVAVTDSLVDPVGDFEINARGTLNVLEAVRLSNIDAPILFASTNKVYGRLIDDRGVFREAERYVPADPQLAHGVSEESPLDFYSPYGCSKGSADQYVRDYARVFGLRTVVMRMSCIYGPRQFGTEDQGWIAHFLLSALRKQPLTIFGDGYQVRDALYVSDAVDAWLGVLDRAMELGGRIFNLGGGLSNSISLRELMNLIADQTGANLDYSFADWRPGDQPWYVSDTRALSKAIGWHPRFRLHEGLALLNEWLTERFVSPSDKHEVLA